MQALTITLHRTYEPGKLCFDIPKEPELQMQLKDLLTVCKDKNNDYVSVTLKRPYAPRTTGPRSQNHHLNGHIVQICNYTGNDYETIKYCVKMIAVEQMGYPAQTIAGHIIPKRETDCNTQECGMLIEASHILAAQMGLVLQEANEDE